MTQEVALDGEGKVEGDFLDGFLYREITVNYDRGLHMRPIQEIQELRKEYEGKANLEFCLNGEGYVTAGFLSLMSLGATEGTVVKFKANGDCAVELLDKVEKKLEDFANGVIE